jgi:hypothetical protein
MSLKGRNIPRLPRNLPFRLRPQMRRALPRDVAAVSRAFEPIVRFAQMPEGGKITLYQPPRPESPPSRHFTQAQFADQIERALLRNLQRLLDHAG